MLNYSPSLFAASEISSTPSFYSDHPRMNNSSGLNRCLVCHDRASGIHFGVSTCEACKAFFRRTSLSNGSMPHPCSPSPCEINIKNRNNCPSCRFDKCKRLGMDRENVIYGKPSKQPFYQQDHYLEQLTKIFHQLRTSFHTIQSSQDKQQIDTFGNIAFQLFYPQTSPNHSSDVIHRVFHLLDRSTGILANHLHLRSILCLWLFVYYYETFLHKQPISQERLIILIKLLDIELNQLPQYYENDRTNSRIEFINTFTILTDLFQEI